MSITVGSPSKGAHTRTSLARESDSARVPMSQTRPCVSRHAHTCVVNLIRGRLLAEPDSRARLVRVWATKGTKCLHPLEHWDNGFESHSRHGCVFVFILCLC
jgi:hypothetical protein